MPVGGPASGDRPTVNRIALLDADTALARAEDLGAILIDCVAGGASIFYMDGLSNAGAAECFRGVAGRVGRGESLLLAAYANDVLRGTIEVILTTPPNQSHRAELSKLLVHRGARWRGLGRSLVLAAEAAARAHGKTLLSLDTTVGSLAERLFAGLDYRRLGVIPGYALHPNGLPSDAIFFWKPL